MVRRVNRSLIVAPPAHAALAAFMLALVDDGAGFRP